MSFNSQGYKKAIETEFTIINKEKVEVPFALKRPQEDFLNHMGNNLNIVVLKARKLGFSSVILAVAVLKFIFGENERCVSMSFDATAAAKQLERAKHFLRSFEIRNKQKLPLKYNSKSEMVFEGINKTTKRPYTNTLRIGTAKSGSFGRGDDISFLHITEAAYCTDMETLLSGVGEATVTGAHKILETTANGFNEFKNFWDEAKLGNNGYLPLFYGPEWEYSEEYLAQKEKNLGRLFAQEYPRTPEEAFLTSGDCFFDTQVLGEILQGAKEPIALEFEFSNKWRQYRKLAKGEFILISVDTSAGGGDSTTAQCFSKTKLDIPLVFQSKATTADFIPELVMIAEKIFDITGKKPVVCIERNNGGAFLIDRVAGLNYAGKYEVFKMPRFGSVENNDPNLLGWSTNTATRPKMLAELKDGVDKKLFRIYDRQTINEMLSFIVVQTSSSWKAQAETGAHDDLVMALAIAWQMQQICEPAKSNKDYSKYENYKQEDYDFIGLR